VSGAPAGGQTKGSSLLLGDLATRVQEGIDGWQPLNGVLPEHLLRELDEIERVYASVLERSTIRYVNPNGPNSPLFFVGAADWGWGPSDVSLEATRMNLLGRLRDWQPRFELLFPHPTPEVAERHQEALELTKRWLIRDDTFDHSVPGDIPSAVTRLYSEVARLRASRDLLPADSSPVRVVVDTNALIDEPNLAVCRSLVGPKYVVHILPVVMRELDDHKRGGRTETHREAAKRADRRLKGLRDRGEVRNGVRVEGDVTAVFEHLEPRANANRLPSWLDLAVPDDRFVASTLLLQSGHPGSRVYVATSDLNLQTKLAAVGLPYLEPPAG
jgi:rRNA-processing protein FCF1